MIIPFAEHAVVEASKVREYLLSLTHPVGRFKTLFFARLGYRQDNWLELQRDLLKFALSEDAEAGGSSRFGAKYIVHAMLRGPSGRAAAVVTVWMVRTDENIPRLITAYPGGPS